MCIRDSERSEDDSVVCTQVASSTMKDKSVLWKKKARKRRKLITNESKSSLLKSVNTADEPESEDSTCNEFALRQSIAECHCSPQHTSMEPVLFAEAVELPELNDAMLTDRDDNHRQLHNFSEHYR